MSGKKSNYWYVLVLTNEGPKYVTDYHGTTAEFDKLKKPVEMSKSMAQDMVLGLNLNGWYSLSICMPFKIDEQPYRYQFGKFEWVDDFTKEESK